MTDDEFLTRWRFWGVVLNDPQDGNSLVQQMETLCWDIGIFQCLMASWETEKADDGQTLRVNSVLYHFLVDNFVRSVFLGLRRITERTAIEKRPREKKDRSVYSLAALLDDIRKHREEYTRRRLFLALGLEIDVEKIEQQHNEYVLKNYPRGGASFIPRELNEMPSQSFHEQWDRLCCCSDASRSYNDLLSVDHIDSLDHQIVSIRERVEAFVNKHLAHAATPQSRESAVKPKVVTLPGLIDLVIEAGRLVNSLSAILASAVFDFLAVALYDKWQFWQRGWGISATELESTWRTWHSRVGRLEPLFPTRSR